MSQETIDEEEFDFTTHRKNAENAYSKIRRRYEDFSNVVKKILEETLTSRSIKVHSITARAKTVDRFGEKAAKPLENNPKKPAFPDPLHGITDLAGVRVITFFTRTLNEVDQIIYEQFEVLEKSDKRENLEQEGKLGYQSVHYIVKLSAERIILPEYAQYAQLVAEIQVRTILQHAWAEIEHDIQYIKSPENIPRTIRRRFMSLAGLLEIADREFQVIQDDFEEFKKSAMRAIKEGKLGEVELTPYSLKDYLDYKLGSDGRMSSFSYEFETRLLRRLGFMNLQQIDECIKGYDADSISKILWGSRQGQLNRFEAILLAGTGERFIDRHLWTDSFFIKIYGGYLEKLKKARIPVGEYKPS